MLMNKVQDTGYGKVMTYFQDTFMKFSSQSCCYLFRTSNIQL